MKVQPNPSGQTPRPSLNRTDRATGRTPEPHTPPAPGLSFENPTRDNAEVSSEARELQRQAATGAPEGTLEPARMRQVLGRMTGGWYDTPEVRSEVVEKIRKEL